MPSNDAIITRNVHNRITTVLFSYQIDTKTKINSILPFKKIFIEQYDFAARTYAVK